MGRLRGSCFGLSSRLAVAVALVIATLGVAAAQDTRAPRDVFKQVVDNERVRVFEVQFPPGAKVPPRAFMNHLLFMVTDGTLVFTDTGKTPYEMTFKAGETYWFSAITRGIQNDTDKLIRILVVEVKEGGGRVVAGKIKPKPKAKRK